MSATTPRAQAEPGAAGGHAYAGFWIRGSAYGVDGVILYLVVLAIGYTGSAFVDVLSQLMGGGEAAPEPPWWFGIVVDAVAGLVYFTVFSASAWQATPGKRWRRIYLMRADGGRVTIALALARYFAYILSGLPLGLGFMLAGWTPEKRALHDMICRTRVVHGRV